ncbi:MAG TPA: translocation/assembly module TamB domain-containing protein [Thermoanaerobaculia bacterium]|jgi:translocation and assembly module TamB
MSPDTPTPPETAPEAAPPPPSPPPKKRRRWLRWTLGILLVLCVLLVLLLGGAWYTVSSERGTRVVLTRLAGMIPGELTVGSQRGPLTGPLELRDVHYKTDAMDVRVKRVFLDWHARQLRRRMVDIERLHANGIRIVLPPAKVEEETEDGRLIDIHLPVNIIVRDALIRDVEIVRAGQPPFRLDRIALDARSERLRDVVHVRSLQVDGPIFRLRAQGDLNPVGAYGVNLRAQATYDPPQYPPFVVTGAFNGTLERLGVAATLTQPFDAKVQGNLLTPMRELGMDLAAQVRGFDAKEINPEWPVARVSRGDVKIRGQLDNFTSEGRVFGSYEGYGSGEADYRLARRGEDFFFEYLNLKTENGADLSAKGTVGTGTQDLDLDLVADWHRLAWPLQGGAPVVVSRSGEARIRGSLADYEVAVNAYITGPSIPPGHWVLAGRGNKERMNVRSVRGDLLRGRLAAAGTVSWKPAVSWRLRATGDGINPGAQWPEWPGSLDFAVASNGVLRSGAPYGRVDLTDFGGNLRGNPVAGRVQLELAGDRYHLPGLDVRSGSARLTAAGAFTKSAGNLDWRLEAPNLGEALPDAGGSLTAQGNLAGPWKAPRVRAQAGGQSLVFRTYNVETVALAADVDLSRNGPMLIDLDAANVGVSERRFETVTLDGSGTRGAHELALAVRAKEGSFDLALAGGLTGTTDWSGEIRRLDLQNQQTGNWSLAGPAGLAAGTTRAALRNFCWTSTQNNGARLCAEGQWSKTGPWNASGNIADLPFSLFKPFLPPDLEITGGVNGTFTGTGTTRGFVNANVDIHPGPGEIRYPTTTGETARIRYDQGTVRLVAGADGLTGHADLAFVDTGLVKADLRLPQYNVIGAPLQSQTVGGRIVADFTNLNLVEAFAPDLENPRGTLTADLTLGGTVAKPTAIGAARLEQAQVDVPRYGLKVRQIQFTAASEGQGPIRLQGSARSGQGTVTLAGAAALDGSPTRITVEGRNFLASDTKEAKVIVSPNMEIAMQGARIDVNGDVTIPEAEIGQQKRRQAAIPVSQDVIIIPPSEENLGTPEQQRQLFARIRVILGEKVTVKAYGFNGRPTGSLLVIEQPGKATVGVGQLVIQEGVYKAYGQDLTLDRGRLIFAGGPIANPGLDLRAYRKADDGTVAGINVKGTLRSPQTTVYSDPPMGESEALAYLLLGHPLGQATPQEGNLVANAANSLGLKGGNLIAKKLAARFGLEEARIESTGGLKESSLVVGKYLSPRLYVTYGLGLFEPVSTFRIRYILGRQWTIKAEQGEETSADFLYTIERGKGGETPVPPKKEKGEEVKAPPTTTGTGGGSEPP